MKTTQWQIQSIIKLMVAGLVGLLFGLVLGPPFLDGGSVLGEVVDAVLGLLDFAVRWTLVKLVSFGVSIFVDAVLPWLRVGITAP